MVYDLIAAIYKKAGWQLKVAKKANSFILAGYSIVGSRAVRGYRQLIQGKYSHTMVDYDGDTQMYSWGDLSTNDISDDEDNLEKEYISSIIDYRSDRPNIKAKEDKKNKANNESKELNDDDNNNNKENKMFKLSKVSKVFKKLRIKLIKLVILKKILDGKKILKYWLQFGKRIDKILYTIIFVIKIRKVNLIKLIFRKAIRKVVKNIYFKLLKKYQYKVKTKEYLNLKKVDKIIKYTYYKYSFIKMFSNRII